MACSPQPSRVAEREDAEEVAYLLDRFQLEYEEYTPGERALAPRVIRHIEEGLSVFLLARCPRAGVAQLRFREYLLTAAPMGYLEELYVVPEHRGEGHGRALLETALSVARERRATSVELGTALSDVPARRLYESFGFTNLEKPGRPETQMLYYELEL